MFSVREGFRSILESRGTDYEKSFGAADQTKIVGTFVEQMQMWPLSNIGGRVFYITHL